MSGLWAFAAATVVWGYGCLLWNLAGQRLGGIEFWILLFAASAAAWVRAQQLARNARAVSSKSPFQGTIPPIERLFDVCVLLAFVVILFQALLFPMHFWDGIVLYGFKAKILFWEGTYRTPAFQDSSFYHMNADYPLLIPYLEASFYKLIGHADDRWVRLLFVAYWVVFIGIIYEGLKIWLRPRVCRAAVAVVATLPLFSGEFMGQASSGFVDIAFACYWTGFWVALFRREKTGDPAWRWLAIVMALGGAFTKNEGLPLFFLGWGLLALFQPARRGEAWGGAFWLLLLLAPWLWVRFHLTHNSVHTLHWPALGGKELLDRARQTLWAWLREAATIRSWGIFWGILVAALLWRQKGRPFPWMVKMLLWALGLQIAVYGWAYLCAPYDLQLLLPITQERLMIHLIGPAVLAVGARFQEQL
jgi:hypothetical protein